MTSLLEGRLSATSNTFMTAIYSQNVPQIQKDAETRAVTAGYIPSRCLAWRGCMRANHASAHATSAAARLFDDVKGWSEWFSMQSRTISSWLALLSSVLVWKHTYLSIFLYIIIMYTVHCRYRVRTRMMFTHADIRVKFMILLGPLHPPPPMVMVPTDPLWSGWWKSDDGVDARDSFFRLYWKWRRMDT